MLTDVITFNMLVFTVLPQPPVSHCKIKITLRSLLVFIRFPFAALTSHIMANTTQDNKRA